MIANDNHLADEVGESTEVAREFAHDLRLQLLIVSGVTFTAADRHDQAARASRTWPALCREMARLGGLAPNAAGRGHDADAKLLDLLEDRGLAARQGAGMDPGLRVALFADVLEGQLAAANVIGIPRSERVAHLEAAFRTWPALCRAAINVPELAQRQRQAA